MPPARVLSFLLLALLLAAPLRAQGPSWRCVGFADRFDSAMAFDTDRQRLIVFGGATDSPGAKSSNGQLNDTWEWDGADWRRCNPPLAPSPRARHAMVYDRARHCTVLFGGAGTTETWTYDGQAWRLRPVTTAPPAITISPGYAARVMMAYDADRQRVTLVSGAAAAETWEWDGTAWTRRTPSASPPARVYGAVAYDERRHRLVLFGGGQGLDIKNLVSLNDTWEWDGETWTQYTPTASPQARQGHRMVYDATRERIVLYGGDTHTPISSSTSLSDLWEWDGQTWTQCAQTSAPVARERFELIYDPVRRGALLFGGDNTGAPETGSAVYRMLSDLWKWDGAAWSKIQSGMNPPRHGRDAMAFDERRGCAVLFGGVTFGSSGGYLDQTWEWNGSYWVERHPANSPPARDYQAMAYDKARGRVVLFGGAANIPLNGQTTTSLVNDTWEWDGVNWIQCTPANAPPPRCAHALAYDAARGRSVLFGGSSYNNIALNDTWEWDGVNWTQCHPATSPAVRYSMGMVYDTARNRVLLCGGNIFGTDYNDTWEWDGVNWTKRGDSFTQRFRYCSLAFDEIMNRAVLLTAFAVSSSGSWEWENGNWTRLQGTGTPGADGPHALAYDSTRGQIVLFQGGGGVTSNNTWVWSYPSIVTTTSTLSVPEGGLATLGVRLATQPTTTTVVTASRFSGPAELFIHPATATQTFTPQDWREWKTVSVRAGCWPDKWSRQAIFRFSAPGWADSDVVVKSPARPNAGAQDWARYR